MKSLQQSSVAAVASRGVRFLQRSAFGGVLLASVFACSQLHGQGSYYPETNPGIANYGNFNYTGITVASNVNLQALQNSLTTLYNASQLPPGGGAGIPTLQVPIPSGHRAPTAAEYAATVGATLQNWLQVPANIPSGASITTLANEAIGYSQANRGTTADMIAKVVLLYTGTTYNSNVPPPNSAAAVSNLFSIANSLAQSQPLLIDTIMPNILNDLAGAGQASTPPVGTPAYYGQNLATYWGANNTTAYGIPSVASGAIMAIPRDFNRVSSITGSALSAINGASATILSTSDKSTLYIGTNGVVQTIVSLPVANNNPALLNAVTKTVTSQSLVGIGGTTLAQVLTAAKTALTNNNTVNNLTLGALASGALTSQPSQGAVGGTIDTTLGTAATSAVVYGYNNSGSTAALAAAVTANPTLADMIAEGAVTKGTLTPATVVQYALSTSSTTAPQNIVAAAVLANQAQALNTVKGAINTSLHQPYGAPTVTFGNIAYGGAVGAPIEQIGNVAQTVLTNSAASTSSLNTSVVQNVVDQALQGAQAGGNPGAYADVIYKSEVDARNTSGASAALTTQAVMTLSTIPGGGASISYLGEIAALAGDTGSNFTAIKTAGDAELTTTSGDTVASGAGSALINLLRTQSSKTFVNTITAFNTAVGNASPTNSVYADLYAAVLTNPSESDAALASAIKQSSLSDSTLTSVADDSYRVTYANDTLSPALAMVDAVTTYIKGEALTGFPTPLNDVVDYIGHQIILNTSLTKDIAIAATVVDPDNANFIAHSVAFNNPTAVSGVVSSIFSYAQITNPSPLALPTLSSPSGAFAPGKTFPGSTKGAIIDQPAAAAAITAGLTTGIIEAQLDSGSSIGPNTQSALISTITAAVAASITQNGTNLKGPVNPFNNAGDTSKSFQQSDGGVGTSTNQQTVGAAGAITGFIAEVTQSGDATISAVTKAVITAAVGGSARNYALQIAQAAAQAFGWVSGSTDTTLSAGHPAYDIALAMSTTVSGFATLTQLENAAVFGINQAAAGVIGAGALGLNTTSGTGLNNGTPLIKATGNTNSQFYVHRSAAGTPVTDIFNL